MIHISSNILWTKSAEIDFLLSLHFPINPGTIILHNLVTFTKSQLHKHLEICFSASQIFQYNV